jgi:hypothetical protein
MLTAKRTLVKSGPELWAEISDPAALGAHFEAFGEIRITRVADASLVEWEGERAAGRLELEPSGFGTKVELSAEVATRIIEPEPVAPPPPPPAPPEPPAPEPMVGFWKRLFGRQPQSAAAAPPPEPPAPPPPPAPPRVVPLIGEDEALAVLTATLDALGSARHRPFSR